MQATDPDGQSSAPAPGVLGAVPAVDIDAIRTTHDANAAFGTSVLCTLSGAHSALSAQ